MSTPKKPDNVLFFVGIICRRNVSLLELLSMLERHYGDIHSVSIPVPFHWTDYYNNEMTDDLLRFWIEFEAPIQPDDIVERKHISWEIEKKFFDSQNNRTVNVDPGYITPARLVLTTFKDFSHRIYLGEGVYGEITLMFSNNHFNSLPWTFYDYKDESNHYFFYQCRERILKLQRRTATPFRNHPK
jgi:hypothetical protein